MYYDKKKTYKLNVDYIFLSKIAQASVPDRYGVNEEF